MFMIEILSTNVDKSLWVLDTGSASHICNDMQGLQDSRRLARGEVIIRVGMAHGLRQLQSEDID